MFTVGGIFFGFDCQVMSFCITNGPLFKQWRENTKKWNHPLWLTLARFLVSVLTSRLAMWRDVHSYLSHVLVRAQETLDVTEHLSDRHFAHTVEATQSRRTDDSYYLKHNRAWGREDKVISAPRSVCRVDVTPSSYVAYLLLEKKYPFS